MINWLGVVLLIYGVSVFAGIPGVLELHKRLNDKWRARMVLGFPVVAIFMPLFMAGGILYIFFCAGREMAQDIFKAPSYLHNLLRRAFPKEGK